MNNIQGKIWGKTQALFNKNNVQIHRIETKKGGYCSKHKHEHCRFRRLWRRMHQQVLQQQCCDRLPHWVVQ